MGELLAKELDSLIKAKTEQLDTWHESIKRGSVRAEDFPNLVWDISGVLRQAIVYLAAQVEDPPRGAS